MCLPNGTVAFNVPLTLTDESQVACAGRGRDAGLGSVRPRSMSIGAITGRVFRDGDPRVDPGDDAPAGGPGGPQASMTGIGLGCDDEHNDAVEPSRSLRIRPARRRGGRSHHGEWERGSLRPDARPCRRHGGDRRRAFATPGQRRRRPADPAARQDPGRTPGAHPRRRRGDRQASGRPRPPRRGARRCRPHPGPHHPHGGADWRHPLHAAPGRNGDPSRNPRRSGRAPARRRPVGRGRPDLRSVFPGAAQCHPGNRRAPESRGTRPTGHAARPGGRRPGPIRAGRRSAA